MSIMRSSSAVPGISGETGEGGEAGKFAELLDEKLELLHNSASSLLTSCLNGAARLIFKS